MRGGWRAIPCRRSHSSPPPIALSPRSDPRMSSSVVQQERMPSWRARRPAQGTTSPTAPAACLTCGGRLPDDHRPGQVLLHRGKLTCTSHCSTCSSSSGPPGDERRPLAVDSHQISAALCGRLSSSYFCASKVLHPTSPTQLALDTLRDENVALRNGRSLSGFDTPTIGSAASSGVKPKCTTKRE
jgi:hypothetical protein